MMRSRLRLGLSSLFIFGAFFLANLPAGLTLVWLIPAIVYLEAVLWIVPALICAWVLSRRNGCHAFWQNLAKNWIILPFLLLAGISIAWSVEWGISLARWLVLVCTIIVGGFIGLRQDTKQIVKLLSAVCIFILVVSALLVFLAPRIGVMNYYDIQGAWKGMYWHKNHMGIVAAFACLLFLIRAIGSFQSHERSVWWWAVLYVLSLVFVYQTDSVASYLALIVLHGVVFMALAYLRFRDRLRRRHYLILAVLAILGIVVLSANMHRVFALFNRNTSLTGRVPMWRHLFDIYFSQRPLGGYGFNAFWYVEDHRVIMQHAAGYPDQIVISDNGFIDILMNTGYVGLALFLVFYLVLWGRSIRYALRASDVFGLFPFILMAYTLLANLTWSLLFENESFMLLTMMAVMFSLSSRPLVAARESVPDNVARASALTKSDAAPAAK